MFYGQKPGHMRFECEKHKRDKQKLIQSVSKPQFQTQQGNHRCNQHNGGYMYNQPNSRPLSVNFRNNDYKCSIPVPQNQHTFNINGNHDPNHNVTHIHSQPRPELWYSPK